MTEPVKNIAASIQARLKNEAERQARPFAEVLQYYVMERFLYRLSKTKYALLFQSPTRNRVITIQSLKTPHRLINGVGQETHAEHHQTHAQRHV